MNMIATKESIGKLENIKEKSDIYSGEETIRFNNRHPIYRALMKIEFEDVLRNFQLKKSDVEEIWVLKWALKE